MITILGTGQVGIALLDQLRRIGQDRDILLVNKSGVANFDRPAGARVLGLDATNPDNLVDVFRKSELVFSCTDVPYPLWGTFYPRLSNAIVKGLKQSHAKLVFADNMYSYGNQKGGLLSETLSHRAQTNKGKIRADLIKNFEANGINHRVAIVKSSDFIGPRIEKGVFGLDFLKSVYDHKTVNLPGNINLPHHFTFIEDFAKAMVQVAFAKDAYEQIWHVPNAPAISQKAWIQLFEHHIGLKIKYRAVPKIAVRIAGLFNPFIRELKELAYQFEYPCLIDSNKFVERFGDLSTPHDEIVRKTVEWFNHNNSKA